MARDERVRLFVGLPVPEAERAPLVAWAAGLFRATPVRLVGADDLHFTVAFLGAVERSRIDEARAVVRAFAGFPRARFRASGVRLTRSVGMLVLDDVGGGGEELVGAVQRALADAGLYEPEPRPWLPHVTVARWKERPVGVRTYVPVMEIVPSEIAVFLSVLRRGGAQYEVLDSAALGG